MTTASPLIRLMLMAQGESVNSWGDPNLNNAMKRLEEASKDVQTIALSGGTYALTASNYIADEARAAAFVFSGTGGTVTYPNLTDNVCRIYNSGSASLTFKYLGSGSGVVVQAGEGCDIVGNGSEYYKVATTVFDASAAFSATSSTAVALGTGDKTYTIASGKAFATGMNVRISDNAAPTTNYADGVVKSYSGTTIVITVSSVTGSGTPATVTIAFSQAQVSLPNQTGNSGKYLTTNGSAPSWGTVIQYAVDEQVFSSSGTWTKPSNPPPSFVLVELWAAGGGGGSGNRADTGVASSTGGSGGGGGQYTYRFFKASDLSSTVSVTIGSGGTGGAAVTSNDTAGNNGVAGGNSSFGSYLTAYGGGGGLGAAVGSNSSGGAGGSAYGAGSGATGANTTADRAFSAGSGGSSTGANNGYGGANGGGDVAGGAGSAGGASIYAGAGGGAGGCYDKDFTIARAGGAGGAQIISGTSGGAGGAATGAAGTAGANGAGGGGGGGRNGAGGAGGAGSQPGGGGGGGAGSPNGSSSGAGGVGGSGYAKIYTW